MRMFFRPVFLLGLLTVANTGVQPARQPSPPPVSVPKLMVGIVVDQMRADFQGVALTQLRGRWQGDNQPLIADSIPIFRFQNRRVLILSHYD